MNILGMGPMEVLLIIILALIVFGPAKLPEIMGQVGKAIGDFRRATSELSDEFNRTIQTELGETRQVVAETKAALTDVRTAVVDVHRDVNAAVSGLGTVPSLTASPSGAQPPLNGTSSGAHPAEANGAAPALADTSQWHWETADEPAAPSPGEAIADAAPVPLPGQAIADQPSVSAPGHPAAAQPDGPAHDLAVPSQAPDQHRVARPEAGDAQQVPASPAPPSAPGASPRPPGAPRPSPRDELLPPY